MNIYDELMRYIMTLAPEEAARAIELLREDGLYEDTKTDEAAQRQLAGKSDGGW